MPPCSGPCLPRCYRCHPAVAALAHLAMVYTLACVGYLVRTRRLGTPFADSLTDEQRAIKRASAAERARIFKTSALAAAAGVVALGRVA